MGPEEPGADDLTAHDVVMLGRLPHRAWFAPPSPADHAAVEAAMQATQSWPWRTRRLSSLSSGERQRVLLARVLAVQAAVTLMDEPSPTSIRRTRPNGRRWCVVWSPKVARWSACCMNSTWR